jgi:hypothetical protein
MSIKIDKAFIKISKWEKELNDVIDWHVAYIKERDENKQKLYRMIHENKVQKLKEKVREVYDER